MTFDKGQRVNTPNGLGTINYQRMVPPDYSEAMIVSVFLDSRQLDRDLGKYSGTIFPADVVTPIQ